jgi:hypothetical protein
MPSRSGDGLVDGLVEPDHVLHIQHVERLDLDP